MPIPSYDVCVLGGGASGLAAALAAARGGAHVCVLEHDVAAGLSILATGNGRCNISNAHLDPQRFLYPHVAKTVFGTHGEQDIVEFFESLGLLLVQEDEGRLYPYTRRAESVRDVLLSACAREGVDIRCCHELGRASFNESTGFWELIVQAPKVQPCSSRKGDFKATLRAKRRELSGMAKSRVNLRASSIIIACGGANGSASTLAALFSLPHEREIPVLCPLATQIPCAPSALEDLDGLRVSCKLSLSSSAHGAVWLEQGEVLFRPYGISGIAAFNLSRRAQANDTLELDFFPKFDHEQLLSLLAKRSQMLGAFSPQEPHWLDGLFAPALARVICKLCNSSHVGTNDLERLAHIAKHFPLQVLGTTEHAQAQVHRGGISFEAVELKTLAIHNCPKLFACGEALDMDADCGGYNLGWAWLSGLRAGASASAASTSQFANS